MKFIEEIKRPFNIITLTLAVASIILSVFFYLKSQKTKSLSYKIDETVSVIYDSENSSSKIKLFEKDSILITESVYLITGTLWNSGDIPIYEKDIRKDIELIISSNNRILDYKITKQKDPDVANFSLTSINNNTLKVDWKYFDPNYGFNFQIVYLGDKNSEFYIKGKVLDIDEIVSNPDAVFIKSLRAVFKYIFILIPLILLTISAFSLFTKNPKIIMVRRKIPHILILILSIISTLITIIFFLFSNVYSNPI